MDKFSCKASPQQCFETMMKTAVESYRRTVWRIQSPIFKGLASDCGPNNTRRLSTKKLIEFLAHFVNLTGFQRERDCSETEPEPGFVISFYCVEYHGLQGHDVYTLDSSDPSYVVMVSELSVRGVLDRTFHVVLPLFLLFVCLIPVIGIIGGPTSRWKLVRASMPLFFILLGLACTVWKVKLHVNSAMQPNANVQTHGPTQQLLAESERLFVLLPNHPSCRYEVWRHNYEKEFGPPSSKIQATSEFCSDVKSGGEKTHPHTDTSWPCVQIKRLATSMENQIFAHFYGNCSVENVTNCTHKGTIQTRELLSRFKLICLGGLKTELEQQGQERDRTAILIPKEFFMGKYSRLWKPAASSTAAMHGGKAAIRRIIFDSQGDWTGLDRIYAKSTFTLEDRGTKSKVHNLFRTLAQSGLDTLWKEQLRQQKWATYAPGINMDGGAVVGSDRGPVTLWSITGASSSLLQFLAFLLFVTAAIFIYESVMGKAGWKRAVGAFAFKLEKLADYLAE